MPPLSALLHALHTGTPVQRRAAAFSLRRRGASPAAVRALCRALTHDADAEVRRTAAVSLGKIGLKAALPFLAESLTSEAIPAVRASVILAVGAIGGVAAREVLDTLHARTGEESDALRRAKLRTDPPAARARWRTVWSPGLVVLLDVPPGLEDVAVAEAAERGLESVAHIGPGRLRCPPGTAPWDAVPPLRCVRRVLLEGSAVSSRSIPDGESLTSLVRACAPLQQLRGWLDAAPGAVRYRLDVEGRPLPREVLLSLVAAVREAARPLGLIDDPGRYDIQLVLELGARTAGLHVHPTFAADTRFAYRRGHSGAGVEPAVAACLARLAGAPSLAGSAASVVVDPTCGSGTLLIERGLRDPGAALIGIDASTAALRTAEQNAETAGLGRRVRLVHGDAADAANWQHCSLALANLPFGRRTRLSEEQLAALYDSIVSNIARFVVPGGRALLYTTEARLVTACLPRYAGRLSLLEERRIATSGLVATALVLSRLPHTARRSVRPVSRKPRRR